jgi:hypothetical protein
MITYPWSLWRDESLRGERNCFAIFLAKWIWPETTRGLLITFEK